jgi:hypothetical protein
MPLFFYHQIELSTSLAKPYILMEGIEFNYLLGIRST